MNAFLYPDNVKFLSVNWAAIYSLKFNNIVGYKDCIHMMPTHFEKGENVMEANFWLAFKQFW